MSSRAWGLIAACVLLGFAEVRAQEAVATPAPKAATVATTTPATYPPHAPAGGTAQLAIYFVLLLALLGGGVYVMRNGLGFLQPKPKGPRKLEITETRMLGNRQFLIVAEYEQRKMLIGVCPGRIDYLCTLSGAEPEFPKLSGEEDT